MKWHRVRTVVRRHYYEVRRNFTRLTEAVYWPVIDILVWGFFTVYLSGDKHVGSGIVGALLGAVILWNLFYAFQRDVAVGFLDELWSRNLITLFASPLNLWEYLAGVVIVDALKITTSLLVAGSLAWLLYSFNIFHFGFALLPHLFNLLFFALSIGIFTGALILRYSTKIEILAWSFASILQPVACVYYPIASLPHLLQLAARLLPVSYAFEGLRSVIAGGSFDAGMFLPGAALNVFYFGASLAIFRIMYTSAKRKGTLVKTE